MLIDRIDCETPQEFLEAIGPLARTDEPRRLRGWVYRGLPSCEYALVPTALRQPVPKLIEANLMRKDSHTEVSHRAAEATVLQRYYNTCDRRGLRVEDNPRMRAHPLHDAPSGAFVKEWPSSDFLQTLALAQHHGLPTRLLDWSHDAMVAAYFASIGATRRLLDGSEETNSGSRLCVWALDHLVADTAVPLRFVAPPYAENPNLAAQQGLFTSWVTESLVVDGKIENGEVDRRCLTELLHGAFDKPQVHAFRQITLDVRHSPALASVLRASGYSAGRMFPGYNGAAADVVEGAEIKAAMSYSAE